MKKSDRPNLKIDGEPIVESGVGFVSAPGSGTTRLAELFNVGKSLAIKGIKSPKG